MSAAEALEQRVVLGEDSFGAESSVGPDLTLDDAVRRGCRLEGRPNREHLGRAAHTSPARGRDR